MIERVRLLLENEPRLPATEVLRRARDWGFRGGRSQTAALVKKLRPKPRKEPIVRFDGLPAEYAQFDFGECVVPFVSTGKERVQFFVGRLKFSRYMHVVLVPDQKAETLVRSLFACLVEFGARPKSGCSTIRARYGSHRSACIPSCCIASCARPLRRAA
jgi:transposase